MLRKIYDLIIGFGLIFLLSNCDSVNDSTSNTDRNIKSSKNDDWLVPNNEVFDGGPGRDGIPALTNPDMIEISNASYLGDDDLIGPTGMMIL